MKKDNIVQINLSDLEIAFDRLMILKESMNEQQIAIEARQMLLNHLGVKYQESINDYIVKRFFTLNYTVEEAERIYKFVFKTDKELEIENILNKTCTGELTDTEAVEEIKSLFHFHQR